MDIHADFHLHTNASDGRLNPKELVKLAKSQALSLMAITDHDTTSSLYEGILEGERLVKIFSPNSFTNFCPAQMCCAVGRSGSTPTTSDSHL